MSAPRRLWVRFRDVDRRQRDAYVEAVAAAGVTAESVGAHFWVFAVDDVDGRFVEFLEGPDDAALGRLEERTRDSLAPGSTLCDSVPIGGGLRCTELRDQ